MPLCAKARRSIAHSILALLSGTIGFHNSLVACPGLLLGQHLPFSDRSRIQRDHLALFAWEKQNWRPLSLQVDPLDVEGSLLFPREKDWQEKILTPSDRLSFGIDGFGERYSSSASLPLPCQAQDVIELSYASQYAYLLNCIPDPGVQAVRPVEYKEKLRTVTSDDYSYRYTPSNHLVFEAIQVAGKNGSGMVPVAKDSDLMIVGDVKKFFTLYFDSSDIDAEIIYKRQGPMGLMGGMEFYLNIMAFKINMELRPEVNFFEDSLFMPMSMTLPVDAAKYLRRGSGIYYSWAPEADVEWDWKGSALDDLDLELLDPNGKGPPSKPSPAHCQERYCHYTIAGKAKGRPFVMNFKINRKAADLGFFPQLIRDVPAVEKVLDHKLGRFPGQGRIAIYFETARLPKGTHTWDFWIYFPDKNADEQCSFPIKRQNVSYLLARPK